MLTPAARSSPPPHSPVSAGSSFNSALARQSASPPAAASLKSLPNEIHFKIAELALRNDGHNIFATDKHWNNGILRGTLEHYSLQMGNFHSAWKEYEIPDPPPAAQTAQEARLLNRKRRAIKNVKSYALHISNNYLEIFSLLLQKDVIPVPDAAFFEWLPQTKSLFALFNPENTDTISLQKDLMNILARKEPYINDKLLGEGFVSLKPTQQENVLQLLQSSPFNVELIDTALNPAFLAFTESERFTALPETQKKAFFKLISFGRNHSAILNLATSDRFIDFINTQDFMQLTPNQQFNLLSFLHHHFQNERLRNYVLNGQYGQLTPIQTLSINALLDRASPNDRGMIDSALNERFLHHVNQAQFQDIDLLQQTAVLNLVRHSNGDDALIDFAFTPEFTNLSPHDHLAIIRFLQYSPDITGLLERIRGGEFSDFTTQNPAS